MINFKFCTRFDGLIRFHLVIGSIHKRTKWCPPNFSIMITYRRINRHATNHQTFVSHGVFVKETWAIVYLLYLVTGIT